MELKKNKLYRVYPKTEQFKTMYIIKVLDFSYHHEINLETTRTLIYSILLTDDLEVLDQQNRQIIYTTSIPWEENFEIEEL